VTTKTEQRIAKAEAIAAERTAPIRAAKAHRDQLLKEAAANADRAFAALTAITSADPGAFEPYTAPELAAIGGVPLEDAELLVTLLVGMGATLATGETRAGAAVYQDIPFDAEAFIESATKELEAY
jgi:hypothetical protein